MLEQLTISTLNGLMYGMILFMLASGLTLIFGMMGVLNLAHASLYMVGAYLGYQISKFVGFWTALLLAPAALFFIGAAIERNLLRRVHQFGHVPELALTFGLAFVIHELVQMVWGRLGVPYVVPKSLEFHLFNVFSTPYPAYRIFILAVSASIFVGLYLVLSRTRTGLIVRAALTHPRMVGMLGHDVPKVFMLVFGLGSALAGLAGVIGGPIFVTSPNMAGTLGAILFVVVVVGGLGSLPGALIASLMIGLLTTFAVGINLSLDTVARSVGLDLSTRAALRDVRGVTVAQLAPILPYLLMLAMLVLRPRGLLGKRDV